MKFSMLAFPDFYNPLLVYLSSGPPTPFLHILPEITGTVPRAYFFEECIYLFPFVVTHIEHTGSAAAVTGPSTSLACGTLVPGFLTRDWTTSSALEGELSTTGPRGKSPWCVSYSHIKALSALGWERSWVLFILFPTEPNTLCFLCACCMMFDERI